MKFLKSFVAVGLVGLSLFGYGFFFSPGSGSSIDDLNFLLRSPASNVVDIYPVAPHNSWRLQPNESFQIDVLLTEREFKVFEWYQLCTDLRTIYDGGSRYELFMHLRGYNYKLHIPGLTWPIDEHFSRVIPSDAYDNTKANPQWNWVRKQAPDGTVFALKKIDRGEYKYHVSAVCYVVRK